TDVEGIYRDFADKESLIDQMTSREAQSLITAGVADKGMIPKIGACITALGGGVERAHIIDGRVPHALLVEIFTDQGVGTMIERT
ncbi:MAG TPA: hypothetical protein VFW40_02895, partial [Capsulimonadaceae bacterium]|nr:hypothetical protein [Capsulimonadaceae bacterium]